ncbi:hypothetical protein QBC35DRAFT_284987 [Podospora australis]|uniref:Uncharacterized protein n=1 Tax=Podospora australis TaxID=1536484 RepID=A0AAN6WQ59_9PEZI|nr:hypothetical protein QBC35DRAFT_284987 [Podospora australis]
MAGMKIPGFYFDAEKGKYFRIVEGSSKATAENAKFTAGNVKRRAAEEREAKEKRVRAEILLATRVKRARISESASSVEAILLERETGAGKRGNSEDEVAKYWGASLRGSGQVDLLGPREWPDPTEGHYVNSFWVGGGHEDRGVGVMYAEISENLCYNGYIFRDEQDNINAKFHHLQFGEADMPGYTYRPWLSSFRHHEPSNTLVAITPCFQEVEGTRSTLAIGDPPLEPLTKEEKMRWPPCIRPGKLDMMSLMDPSQRGRLRDVWIHALEVAPGSPLTTVIGASAGLYICDAKCEIKRLERKDPCDVPSPKGKGYGAPKYVYDDVLSVDFLQDDPHTVLAGTRSGHIGVMDIRKPLDWRWNSFKHVSSVAHVKSVGPYGVLAAGPRSSMRIYDIRFLRTRKQDEHAKPWNQTPRPVVEFPDYRNEAHIQTGLAVLTEPGYGRGVVATAHDDCTVGLYSLRDGTRIPSPDVDKIKAPAVVQCMMWQRLHPGEQHPSLYVGVGAKIQSFSWRGTEVL